MNTHETITHAELDQLLDKSAAMPEAFEAEARKLIDAFDAESRDLEITDPTSWRRPVGIRSDRTSQYNQFRSDVESILTLDRTDEARLARRIEFARLRFEKACCASGGDADAMLAGVGQMAATWMQASSPESDGQLVVARDVGRRGAELHALRTEMVERNLYLVLINVERYAQSGASRFDLIQEGCASLFRAVDGFDWRRGLLFRTYAVHWLNQAFRNYIYNFNSTVRVPVYLQKAMRHVHQAEIALGKPGANADEIAERADMPASLVTAARGASRSSFSLDSTSGDGEEASRLRDLLPAEGEGDPYQPRFEDVSLESGLGRAMQKLSEREQRVVRLRFGLNGEREHTLAEVAQELGVSVERVRQIQVRAIAKMDTPSLRKEMDPFLN